MYPIFRCIKKEALQLGKTNMPVWLLTTIFYTITIVIIKTV